jgi:two-component system cell cycle response regulator CpdR
VREFIQRALELEGHLVTAVEDGGRALEALDGADFDLLLTDLAMPRVDGHALLNQVSRERPALPVVVITGHDASKPTRRCRVVPKPFDMNEICNAVADALDGYRTSLEPAAITGREPR